MGPTPTAAAAGVIDAGTVGVNAGADILVRFRVGWTPEAELFFFRLLVCFGD